MSTYSYQASTGTPQATLPPPDPANDTYEWTKIQAARKQCKLLTTSATQPPSVITQALSYVGDDGTPGLSTFKVDSSPKWFTLLSAEFNAKGEMVITLGTVPGKTTPTGRVVRVGSYYSGVGGPGSGKITEYYYQVI